MKVHLLDGTYELFRHHYGALAGRAREPEARTDAAASPAGTDEVAATRGVMWSVMNLLEAGTTHLGVATDSVIESFRNDLWPGYKSSAGMPEELLAQFPLLEEALRALGVTVWGMVALEADDALAAAAASAAANPEVDQVVIMTPDKDLAQCVRDQRVVQLDRRSETVTDAARVVVRYGVRPASIPDWLALVGDSADGFPGLPGWGKQSAATVLAEYGHLEEIPIDSRAWTVPVRSRERLAATLVENLELALLFRNLATLRTDDPVIDDLDELRWRGPRPELANMAARLRAGGLADRAAALAESRAGAGGGAR